MVDLPKKSMEPHLDLNGNGNAVMEVGGCQHLSNPREWVGKIYTISESKKTLLIEGWWVPENYRNFILDIQDLGRDHNCTILQLHHVDFCNQDLATAILSLPQWRHLDLRMCTGEERVNTFVENALAKLQWLEELTISGSSWNVRCFTRNVSRLECLTLENCFIDVSPDVIEALSIGLRQSSTIKTLKIAHCGLRDDKLTKILKNSPRSLKVLDLAGNYCRSDGVAAVAGILLREDWGLESINLTNQHPGEDGGNLDLSLLGLAMLSNRSLRYLDLSFNMLTCYDLQSLIASLAKNCTLRGINLMSNQLGDKAMQLIGQYLPRMKGLQNLTISANRFGEDGANSLLQGVQTNLCLTSLEIPRGFMASERIDYYLAINDGGRRLLRVDEEVPLALWQLVLERANRLLEKEPIMQASVLFQLLQGPVLFREMSDWSHAEKANVN